MGLDGEKLGAQGGYFGGREAGGEETVEAEGLRGRFAKAAGGVGIVGGIIPPVFFSSSSFARVVLLSTGRRRSRKLRSRPGESLGLELRARKLPVRRNRTVNVDARGRLARRRQPEGSLDRCVGG